MKIEQGSKWVLIGDSITDCGRTNGLEKTHWHPEPEFGLGYVNLIKAKVENQHPDLRISIVNKGINGNTIRDLNARWQEDAISEKPDWLSVFIGINDVWRNFKKGMNEAVPLDEYISIYERLLETARKQIPLKGLILIAPYVLILDRANPFRSMMDEYGEAVKRLATKHDALFVDAQATLDRLCPLLSPESLTADLVHLNTTGHLALAKAILASIEGG